MDSSIRVIVTGLLAQHPCLGGVTWDYLQYPLGLARLGHDVYYFEDSGEWPYNLDGGPLGNDWVAHNCENNIKHLKETLSHFGLADKWAYRFPIDQEWYGLSDTKRRDVIRSADLLINVSGALEHPELYRQVPRLIYIDSDPVFTQIKIAKGEPKFRSRVEAHDLHFSFGECLSQRVPKTDYFWQPTRQPIVLSEWRPSIPKRNVLTTIMSWTSYKPLTYGNQSYGQKDVEFARFLKLPSYVPKARLEVALGKVNHTDWQSNEVELPFEIAHAVRNHPEWTARDLLTFAGWDVTDATEACNGLDHYRAYIESSMAEWSVAKNGYVIGQPGWFSCRSACYLAAGKPVIVQDTGFSSILPVKEGILSFRTVEEAAAAIYSVESNYTRHAETARAIAEEYFDSDKILSRLIEKSIE